MNLTRVSGEVARCELRKDWSGTWLTVVHDGNHYLMVRFADLPSAKALLTQAVEAAEDHLWGGEPVGAE